MKRWLLVLLGAMLILGAACGDDGGSTDAGGTDDQETEEAPSEEPTDEETTEPEGGAVTITGVDFAFQVDPPTIAAGETEVTFTNDGQEEHQLLMARLTNDAPSLENLLKLPEKKSDKFIEEEYAQAAKPIKPGESESFTADLPAGTYAMACFISNKEGPHAFQGMFNTLIVE